ncbi:hypothetical protein [Spirosoma utsteinense]|uniref:Uncharacterized protein n=1 Tax=Spirosoma utsteinense TaxID=2585773 RepID=A0ABR6VZZ0_9BACT|nr:hypothetical protein [Spirosoma utsteinense]MBC3786538.1 hypothetical protein [Spirosoma utsteinense]MBC3789916.1 hypothetical protein [Spirosoma utsteinense]
MNIAFRTLSGEEGPINCELIRPTHYTKERADWANNAFDHAVKQFLREWIDHSTVTGNHLDADRDTDTDAFVEHGALRSFFKHSDDALERLLRQDAIARHLLRPVGEVYFENDAYEPMLAVFEKRIYNLAAHREHREVPFRYSPASRQGAHGDTIGLFDEHTGQSREDIGMYFGTRRSDTTALTILGDHLRRQALLPTPTSLPVHVVTEGYMTDSLRMVRDRSEQLQAQGDTQLHCFVIQRRHAADDRHLGAALLVMDPAQPGNPRRIIFCDTLNPLGQPPWWDKFKQKVDDVFPQPVDCVPVSERLEDGGVNLQRLHDGVPVRHQDIDCAFYTASMVSALIQVAQSTPDLILTGSISEVVSAMTARMPAYFEEANQPRDPVQVREENVTRRWNTGREALQNLMGARVIGLSTLEPDLYSAEVA